MRGKDTDGPVGNFKNTSSYMYVVASVARKSSKSVMEFEAGSPTRMLTNDTLGKLLHRTP